MLKPSLLVRTFVQDDIEIHFAEAGKGPTLIFVHGGMGDWTSWEPQWADFTKHFRCITYSRRYSSPNRNLLSANDHSVVVEAQDLSALLAKWSDEPVILVGTSYGAYTALQFALWHPERVSALVLTEPPVLPFADLIPGGRESRLRFERNVLDTATAAFLEGKIELAVNILTLGINGGTSVEVTTVQGQMRRMRNAEAMRALALSADPYPALDTSALRSLCIPTLLLHGERTLDIHQAISKALFNLMPNAQSVCVPESGHGVHRENPKLFNQLVVTFLEKLKFGRMQ